MNIEIVNAPEHRYFPPRSLKLFLAGGISGCGDWQERIMSMIKDSKYITLSNQYDSLYIINPKRDEWVEGKDSARRQIEWEFDMLERCDVFSMYFAGSDSVQPICMYELGRNIERMKQRFPRSWMHRIFITCDESYKRIDDVIVQVDLATGGSVTVNKPRGNNDSVLSHFHLIEENLAFVYPENNIA